MKLEKNKAPFNTIKNMMNYIDDNDLSVTDKDVPNWQRQSVWTNDEQGLLAYSIILGYPISQIILWKKNKIIVPIDGRQRITAIKNFFSGKIAIPDMPKVKEEYRNKKYTLQDGDEQKGMTALTAKERSAFDDYELNCVLYDNIPESIAMDIFVMLQGGKSLTKTEVRAALGGKLCDFVSSLTSKPNRDSLEEDSDVEELSHHPFFAALSANLKNTRKAHRNVADILLHEYLHPGTDKHWSSLESLYRENASSFIKRHEEDFKKDLKTFLNDFSRKVDDNVVLAPQLKTAFMILTVFRCWIALKERYIIPKGFALAEILAKFEMERNKKHPRIEFIKFTAALSNAGYAKVKADERHKIITEFFEKELGALKKKSRDKRRLFTNDQKIAIWERASHQCEYVDPTNNKRCTAKFSNFKKADADHIILWSENGETEINNGRLLCRKHNRGRSKN